MNTEGVKRKLSAILSADVEGYSRLWAESEFIALQAFWFLYIRVNRGFLKKVHGIGPEF